MYEKIDLIVTVVSIGLIVSGLFSSTIPLALSGVPLFISGYPMTRFCNYVMKRRSSGESQEAKV